jgi:hypothetical protein
MSANNIIEVDTYNNCISCEKDPHNKNIMTISKRVPKPHEIKWVKLPTEMGGKKAYVTEIKKNFPCICNKHTVDLRILKNKEYEVMQCWCKETGRYIWAML